MSVVVSTLLPIVIIPVESAIDTAAVPSFALIFVTSILVVSTVVEPKVVIVIPLIVPPSTLSPLI